MKPDGFSYYSDFLTATAQKAVLSELIQLTFTHDSFRGKELKRRYAQFGYAYRSTGRRIEPTEAFPDFLEGLRTKALSYCPDGTRFNQCIITHYPVGAGIGWHTDADQFGDCILGITVTGTARVQFRPNDMTEATYEQFVESGALYILSGEVRWRYQHRVLPVRADRYSLTMRLVPVSERN